MLQLDQAWLALGAISWPFNPRAITTHTLVEKNVSIVLAAYPRIMTDGDDDWNRRPPRPPWMIYGEERTAAWGERLVVAEWEDDAEHNEDSDPINGCSNNDSNNRREFTRNGMAEPPDYRSRNGWKGTDLVHSRNAPARITDYFCHYGPGTDVRLDPSLYPMQLSSFVSPPQQQEHPAVGSPTTRGGTGTVLTGIVHFTAAAESHAGFCHGGSMCCIMDDVVGWIAFCATGTVRPWTGYTVQVNTSLRKPVSIHSVMLVEAKITSVQRRKVTVTARLYDPANDNSLHATCEGLVVMNKGILAVDDEINEQRLA